MLFKIREKRNGYCGNCDYCSCFGGIALLLEVKLLIQCLATEQVLM